MALLQVNFFSQILGMAMTMDVILPEGSQGIGVNARPVWDGEEELPVLYLLHGTSDDHTIWQRRTSIERYVADKKLAVVMPNAHISAYTNQRFGFRFFDFVAEEVPAFCQKYFKISPQWEKNFIAGLSMGGYGALKIGMRCADRFGYAAGLSSGCERMAMLPPQAAGAGSLAELELLKPEMTPEAYQAAIQFFVNFGSPQEYQQYVERKAKKSPVIKNTALAFLTGGLICVLGQLVQNGWSAAGLSQAEAGTATSCTLVFLSALLTGLNLYNKIARFGGAGTLVPITGFANAVVSPAIDFKSEGMVTGMAAKMFIIAGPVLVFGTLASVIYGAFIKLFGGI